MDHHQAVRIRSKVEGDRFKVRGGRLKVGFEGWALPLTLALLCISLRSTLWASLRSTSPVGRGKPYNFWSRVSAISRSAFGGRRAPSTNESNDLR
jgi:hypothetical protein